MREVDRTFSLRPLLTAEANATRLSQSDARCSQLIRLRKHYSHFSKRWSLSPLLDVQNAGLVLATPYLFFLFGGFYFHPSGRGGEDGISSFYVLSFLATYAEDTPGRSRFQPSMIGSVCLSLILRFWVKCIE